MADSSAIISLSLPSYTIRVRTISKFGTTLIPSLLELDCILNLDYYEITHPKNIEKGFLAFLDKTEDQPSSNSLLSQIQTFLSSQSRLITATSPLSLETIFFIIPFRNSNLLGLYKFEMEEVLGNSLEKYQQFINNLQSGQELLRNTFLDFQNKLQNFEKTSNSLFSKCEVVANNCKKTTKQLHSFKREIRTLYKEFSILEKNFQKYECVQCKSNTKNVIFLPCGHVVLCTKCLKEDFKIVVEFPVIENTLKCSTCGKCVEQTLRYSSKQL
ncbi:hypothetical protein SteCoe_29695 [Stentor coeruleus]|uniref:RING-type domain-containing protein n=1 Tax=Stentor coeruleus TaxID=5963 RepID=A0A1R2B597_9CILI|nr:hypothetical protein SteCoe_29695 [Stentor coeruleus]